MTSMNGITDIDGASYVAEVAVGPDVFNDTSSVGVRSGNILIQGMCHLRQNTIVRTLKGIALPIIRTELSTALH